MMNRLLAIIRSIRLSRLLLTVHAVPVPLRFDHLESRITPVVGAFSDAAQVSPGSGLDGVVYLTDGSTLTATGSLLSSGRHVLTAAHVVDKNGDGRADFGLTVRFDLPSGSVSMQVDASAITVASQWAGLNANGTIPYSGHDYAILTLPSIAPLEADRYDIYRGSDEVGQNFTVVGYGMAGVGATGLNPSNYGVKRSGSNQFDASQLVIGKAIVPNGLGLIADFDNGSSANDAFGVRGVRSQLGLGSTESAVAPGDSGGPALISTANGYVVAGVAALFLSGGNADIDKARTGATADNSSFGDFFGYTRTSAFASEIDAIVNGSTSGDTPTSPPTQLPITPPTANQPPITVPVPGRPTTSPPTTTITGTGVFAAGSDAGSPSAALYNADGSVRFRVTPYSGNFTGGVRVATGDVTGDGVPDLITAPGPGTSTIVKVFDGKTGSEVKSFAAYESGFTGGVFLAVDDLNGDGRAEIVTSADRGGGPRVRVFDGATSAGVADFMGIEDSNFRGGTRLAIGDLNNDSVPDLLVGAGFGGGPRVAGFDGAALRNGQVRKLFNDFFIFESSLRNGVFLAVGDINGDGFGELIAGGGPGGGPRVLILNGADITQGKQPTAVANFFAGNSSSRGGIRLAVTDLNDDGREELITGAGEGTSATVSVYSNTALTNATPQPTSQITLGDSLGVFVG